MTEEEDEFTLTFEDIRHDPGLYEIKDNSGYILITRAPAQGTGRAVTIENGLLEQSVLSGAVYISELSEDFGTHIGTYEETDHNVQPVWGAGDAAFRYKKVENVKLMMVIK